MVLPNIAAWALRGEDWSKKDAGRRAKYRELRERERTESGEYERLGKKRKVVCQKLHQKINVGSINKFRDSDCHQSGIIRISSAVGPVLGTVVNTP